MTNTSTTNQTFYFDDYTLSAGTYYLVIQPISLGGTTLTVSRDDGDSGAQISANSGGSWTAQGYSLNATIYADTRPYFTAAETGKYLIQATLNTGVAVAKTIKLRVNNTVVAQIVAGDAGGDGGTSISTLYALTQGDIVSVSLAQASSSTDDVQATGSSFEIIRLR